jgi:hypothetical protein
MEGACFNNSFIVEHTSAQAYVVVLCEKADRKRNAALFFPHGRTQKTSCATLEQSSGKRPTIQPQNRTLVATWLSL